MGTIKSPSRFHIETVGLFVGALTFLALVASGLIAIGWNAASGTFGPLTWTDGLIVIACFLVAWREARTWRADPSLGLRLSARGALLLWLGMSVCAIGFAGAMRFLGPQAIAFFQSTSARHFGILVVYLLGALLFWMRLRCRFVYGFAELLFAMVVAWQLLPSPGRRPSQAQRHPAHRHRFRMCISDRPRLGQYGARPKNRSAALVVDKARRSGRDRLTLFKLPVTCEVCFACAAGHRCHLCGSSRAHARDRLTAPRLPARTKYHCSALPRVYLE